MEERDLLFLVGSLLTLTQHEIGPLILHRPLVLGWIGILFWQLPHPILFFLSLSLELFWLDRVPAGAQRIPALPFGTWAGIATVHRLKDSLFDSEVLFLLSLFVSLFALAIYVPVDGAIRRIWNRLTDLLVVHYIEKGRYPFGVTFLSLLFRVGVLFLLFSFLDRAVVWFFLEKAPLLPLDELSGLPLPLIPLFLAFAFLIRERRVLFPFPR